MRVHFGLEQLQAEWQRAAGCLGTFDGVHLGHQAVISAAVAAARSEAMPSVVVTFDRHPAAVVAPERCPPVVATVGSNLRRFADLGVDIAVVLPFDRAMSQVSPEAFLADVLRGALRIDRMAIGHDFAFGHERAGTPAWLSEQLRTEIVPPLELDGARVSSTAIRQAVADGRVEEAARLLGQPFGVEGVVVEGQRLGRTLGYPTVNLARSSPQVSPADGVYAGRCETPFGSYQAAISVGLRPAVGGKDRTIEAYLLDYPGESLYGRALDLQLERRLREERSFESLDALTEQIARDVLAVRGGRQ